MLVLALDTTTRAGSVALARDAILIDAVAGDAARTHATRLPGDILALLRRHGVALSDIDLFAVAAGPGSFTGLRIGIATIQGLAFANQKSVVAVSALEALACSVEEATGGLVPLPPLSSEGKALVAPTGETRAPRLIGAWMDAQRGEVYAELFGAAELDVVEPPRVDAPRALIDAWTKRLPAEDGTGLLLVGDGALTYRSVIEDRLPRASVAPAVPWLAPAIARLAFRSAERGHTGPPHAVRPLYIRRPDAELARERTRGATGGTRASPTPGETPAPPSTSHG